MKLLFLLAASFFYGMSAFVELNPQPWVMWLVIGKYGFISGILSTSAFFNDLKGGGASWSVTTTDRRALFLILASVCGVFNYVAFVAANNFFNGIWFLLVFGLSVIVPAALFGFFFERIHAKYCLLRNRKVSRTDH